MRSTRVRGGTTWVKGLRARGKKLRSTRVRGGSTGWRVRVKKAEEHKGEVRKHRVEGKGEEG